MGYISLEGVVREFGRGESAVTAVRGIGLHIAQSEFVSIMGESGSGKSTLLSMMGGLLSPSKGKVIIGDIDIYALSKDKLADFRREFMGFIFQSFQLVPYLNVLENVQAPLTVTRRSNAERERLALSALERVGLKDKARRLPNQLSGGEQERVAIARAVVNEPPILFADEPTGNLDSKNSADVMNLLTRLNGEGQTIIMVTHSRANAQFADRLIEVADGEVKCDRRLREHEDAAANIEHEAANIEEAA